MKKIEKLLSSININISYGLMSVMMKIALSLLF